MTTWSILVSTRAFKRRTWPRSRSFSKTTFSTSPIGWLWGSQQFGHSVGTGDAIASFVTNGQGGRLMTTTKRLTLQTTRKLVLASLLSFVFTVVPALASDSKVKVMTRNLYLGADLTPVIAATTPAEFLAAVSAVFAEVQATNFPERAKRLAVEIDKDKPLLIGLQEVAMWRSQFPPTSHPLRMPPQSNMTSSTCCSRRSRSVDSTTLLSSLLLVPMSRR